MHDRMICPSGVGSRKLTPYIEASFRTRLDGEDFHTKLCYFLGRISRMLLLEKLVITLSLAAMLTSGRRLPILQKKLQKCVRPELYPQVSSL